MSSGGKWLKISNAPRQSKSKKVTVLAKSSKKKTVRTPAKALIPRVSSRVGYGSGGRAFCEFIYATKFTINPPAAGLTGAYQFTLNGLFDPDITGVGHQPVNFDQVALMFERYHVTRAEVKASVIASGSQQLAGITVSRDVTIPSAFEVFTENGLTQWGHVDNAASGQAVKEFTMSVDLASMWGMTPNQFRGHDRCDALFSANPQEQAYLLCWMCDAQTGDPGASAWAIEIRYFTDVMGSKYNALS